MNRDHLLAAGFELSAAAQVRLTHFVALLLRENQRVNLTAIRSAEEVWRLHVCESLALLPLLADMPARRLLDLGSGGGIPGIPLACVRDELQVTLLDATRKKLDAADRIATELGLRNIRSLWGRAEDLAHEADYREAFDVVTARGVAALPTLVEYAAGFVRVGGQCWFPKPVENAAREIEDARRAAGQCGLSYVRTHTFDLPDESGNRAVVIYAKEKPLRADLPRAQGRPRRKPL